MLTIIMLHVEFMTQFMSRSGYHASQRPTTILSKSSREGSTHSPNKGNSYFFAINIYTLKIEKDGLKIKISSVRKQ